MRYAFVHKNFRELNFERKVVLVSHALTLPFCFLPWFEGDKNYDPMLTFNAFGGPGFLIGWFIFLISLMTVIYFLDRLLESERVAMPVSENMLLFGAGTLQILLIVLAWSVLFSVGKEYAESAMRFGIFFVFVTQVTALVATFLNSQLDKQTQARSFFQHPDNQQQE